MAIFHDMIEETMEVFMDDFSVFGDFFSSCPSHVDKMLKRYEDTNLVLNWEKCHFIVKEGIVLGHKISKSEIKVDRAKVDVIAKLHHLTSVKVDYDVDPRAPLILGRPFLRITRALIDAHSEELTLRVNDEAITFKGDILYLEKLLNEDPSPNLPPMKNEDLKQANVTMTKPSIKKPPELELKDLPFHLEYAFLEGTDKLPVIISKELKDEEKAALLRVLKSHKWAIAWKISNIKGIDPHFCTHKS
uniref:Reverse transcriptase domain-containing protein n=1 Tax=Tanacetum cinerariifolium TaxID=118510 RepID=A0A699JN08_TANCI|nr:reverse transcriptase domain-containing protein [Tanacetum cinerariifolium]